MVLVIGKVKIKNNYQCFDVTRLMFLQITDIIKIMAIIKTIKLSKIIMLLYQISQ